MYQELAKGGLNISSDFVAALDILEKEKFSHDFRKKKAQHWGNPIFGGGRQLTTTNNGTC